jgi:hypothetical protein
MWPLTSPGFKSEQVKSLRIEIFLDTVGGSRP